MSDKANTPEIYSSKAQSIEEIVSQFSGRNVFTPSSRRNYRAEALDKYKDSELKPVIHIPEIITLPEITYEEYRVKLWEGFQLLKKTSNLPEIKFHQKNATVTIPNIIHYMIGSQDSLYRLNKGIWLWGRFGSGKTDFMLTLLRVHNSLAPKYSNLNKIKMVSYNAIFESCRSVGNTDSISQSLKGYTYIDDFFYQERSEVKLYGNTDKIAELIITRIDQLHKSGYLCLVTSNYDLAILEEKFSLHPGSISRLTGSFNFVPWHGDDLRK